MFSSTIDFNTDANISGNEQCTFDKNKFTNILLFVDAVHGYTLYYQNNNDTIQVKV